MIYVASVVNLGVPTQKHLGDFSRFAVFHRGGGPNIFCQHFGLALLGAEIWEGDERRKVQFLESGDSLNGQNLFTALPFL